MHFYKHSSDYTWGIYRNTYGIYPSVTWCEILTSSEIYQPSSELPSLSLNVHFHIPCHLGDNAKSYISRPAPHLFLHSHFEHLTTLPQYFSLPSVSSLGNFPKKNLIFLNIIPEIFWNFYNFSLPVLEFDRSLSNLFTLNSAWLHNSLNHFTES